jgi:hypothetical protein
LLRSLSWPCPPHAPVSGLGRRPPSEVSGYVQFSGRPRAASLERLWSRRIVNDLERSLQHATEMHLDRACGSGWWRWW